MKALTLAALLAGAPLTAVADTVTLSVPMAGATLHGNAVDMSVSWTRADDAMDVIAVYASKTDEDAPRLLRLRLTDGDKVTFGLPGHAGETFSFARAGDALTVTGAPLRSQLAMN